MTTQFATASYQEIIDINTEADKTSIIGIHTPNDAKPVNLLRGFWEQFRQFRYDGCSIQLVPAARLPADISQVGYGAGESPIDMRDILNPIMFKGCHGNDMGVILNTALQDDHLGSSAIRSDSPYSGFDVYESLYYRALTDNTWKKANPQVGFKKSGLRPLVHTVVSNVSYGQHAPGYYFANGSETGFTSLINPSDGHNENATDLGQLGVYDNNDTVAVPKNIVVEGLPQLDPGADSNIVSVRPTWQNQSFFTNKLVRMSWQDTHSSVIPLISRETLDASSVSDAVRGAAVRQLFSDEYERNLNRCNTVPLAYMGILLLPPAYKTEQYFRMIINHRFSFRRFRGISMAPVDTDPTYNNGGFDAVTPTDYGGYYNGV